MDRFDHSLRKGLTMQREPTRNESTELYDRLIAGERCIVDHVRYNALIDHCSARSRMDELASCQNRHRCGVHDGYVAWIGDENRPQDLELQANGSLYACGSV